MKNTKEKTIETEVQAKKIVRKLVGTVTSDKMDKTVVIQITERKTHPMYGKIYSKCRKLQAHDEKNEFKIGDTVEIAETRPYSKNKSWVVIKGVK